MLTKKLKLKVGKYKGMSLTSMITVDPGYLEWALINIYKNEEPSTELIKEMCNSGEKYNFYVRHYMTIQEYKV